MRSFITSPAINALLKVTALLIPTLIALVIFVEDDIALAVLLYIVGVGMMQFAHASYVGFRLKSSWHQRFLAFVVGYLVLCIFVWGLLMIFGQGSLGAAVTLLILFGLVAPTASAILYAFLQPRYLPNRPTAARSSDDLLDDVF